MGEEKVLGNEDSSSGSGWSGGSRRGEAGELIWDEHAKGPHLSGTESQRYKYKARGFVTEVWVENGVGCGRGTSCLKFGVDRGPVYPFKLHLAQLRRI